jgi:hypothetical protein
MSSSASSTTPPPPTDQPIGSPEAPNEADEMAPQQTKEIPPTQEDEDNEEEDPNKTKDPPGDPPAFNPKAWQRCPKLSQCSSPVVGKRGGLSGGAILHSFKKSAMLRKLSRLDIQKDTSVVVPCELIFPAATKNAFQHSTLKLSQGSSGHADDLASGIDIQDIRIRNRLSVILKLQCFFLCLEFYVAFLDLIPL